MSCLVLLHQSSLQTLITLPDKKATFSFRMGSTSIALICSFLLKPGVEKESVRVLHRITLRLDPFRPDYLGQSGFCPLVIWRSAAFEHRGLSAITDRLRGEEKKKKSVWLAHKHSCTERKYKGCGWRNCSGETK